MYQRLVINFDWYLNINLLITELCVFQCNYKQTKLTPSEFKLPLLPHSEMFFYTYSGPPLKFLSAKGTKKFEKHPASQYCPLHRKKKKKRFQESKLPKDVGLESLHTPHPLFSFVKKITIDDLFLLFRINNYTE